MSDILMRNAELNDLNAIHAIYAYYVKSSLATFEEIVPDTSELQERFEDIQRRGMPYLVCIHEGIVAGYAYASVFRERNAYRYSVEHSIYLHPEKHRLGIGSQMMEELIVACEATGVRQMIAVIGDIENKGSIALHKKFGFEHIGILPATGFKFDRWVDTVLMQRPLGDGAKTPPQGSGNKY